MKLPILIFALLALCPLPGHGGAAETSESALILALQAGLDPAQKAATCRQLKNIGSARAVPALVACLDDPATSHAAREALEVIPGVEAEAALRAALDRTTGLSRVGVLNSIGMRRDAVAVPLIAKLLRDPDALVASAAAHALGNIGRPECAQVLQGVLGDCPAGVRLAVLDGLLQCGQSFLAAGESKKASPLYQSLTQVKEPAYVRQAAFHGWLLSLGRDASVKLEECVQSSDPAAQQAGWQAAAALPGTSITKTLTRLLEPEPPARQVTILKALAQRGDSSAVPAVLRCIKSSEAEVRRTAYDALVDLGDDKAVLPLAEAAATDLSEKTAAAQALAALHRGKPGKQMLALLPMAPAPIQGELIRALASRREAGTRDVFLKYGPTLDPQVQATAIQALGEMANLACLPALTRWLAQAKTDTVREALESCFVTMAGTQVKTAAAMVVAMEQALPGLAVPDRCSYLRSMGRIGGAKAEAILCALGNSDSDAAVRETSLRTLAAYGSREMIPQLLSLSRKAETETYKILALRGYWRLVGLSNDKSDDERLKLCQEGFELSRRVEEKRLGLAELTKITSLPALQYAEKFTTDTTVRSEAELTCVQLAPRLLKLHPLAASGVLRNLAAQATDETVRSQAATLLKSAEQHRDYVTCWRVNGPYRIKGKQAQELFDHEFEPEKNPTQGDWKTATTSADPALFWQVDLGPLMAGNHAVAYLKARVFVPSAQDVRLEIGSDDGVKLWINGKLTHANNAVRGLKAGQDKATGNLKSGWNDFLVKVTQSTQGSGFCLRICSPNGQSLPGMKGE